MKKYSIKVQDQNQFFDLIITLTEHLSIIECQFFLTENYFRLEFVTCLTLPGTINTLKEYLTWDLNNACINSIKQIPLLESCSKIYSAIEQENNQLLTIPKIDAKTSAILNQQSFLMNDKNATLEYTRDLNTIYQQQLLKLKEQRKKLVNDLETYEPITILPNKHEG